MIKFLDELSSLNLPAGKFAIFGSGPLAVRNVRENNDLDVLVTPELFEELSQEHPVTQKQGRPLTIYVGNVQLLSVDYADWAPELADPRKLISGAEIIEGMPFVTLPHLLICKRKMSGAKHQRDVHLLEALLSHR